MRIIFVGELMDSFELTGCGIMKPENRFHNAMKAEASMAAMWWFGDTATDIMPKKVKYNSVKYMMNINQKNFAAAHSNPIIA